MAGLSVFMQGPGSQRNYPTHYLEGAIDVYASCKSVYYASYVRQAKLKKMRSVAENAVHDNKTEGYLI